MSNFDEVGFWADAPTMQLQAQQLGSPQIKLDVGSFSDVTIGEHTVTKRDRSPIPLAVAEQVVQGLYSYAHELKREGISVAELIRAEPVLTDKGYLVEHEVELVEGVSLNQRLPIPAMQRDIIGRVIGLVAGMSTVPGHPDVLRIGIDAATRNWRVDPNTGELKLIDLYPTLLRNNHGSLGRSDSPQGHTYYERMCGTKSGAIAYVLLTAYRLPAELAAHPQGIAAFVDGFQDIVPTQMRDGVIDAIGEYQRVMVQQNVGSAAVGAVVARPPR